jgi:hypothetical protein
MSLTDGFHVRSSAHEAALQRVLMTSKRAAVEVLKGEARILFKNVAAYTPPAHAGTTGRAAETHAKAKVAADIRSLYGTPGEAYDLLPQHDGQADAFWGYYKRGEIREASDLLRAATGSILAPFDAGVHHKRNFRRRARNFRFFVSDPEELTLYVQMEQENIWWLASGWQDALTALGVKGLPYGTAKHNAPGRLKVDITTGSIEITMTNEVAYARQIKDIQRRIQWAMQLRADRMQRNWDNYLTKIAAGSGMKKS